MNPSKFVSLSRKEDKDVLFDWLGSQSLEISSERRFQRIENHTSIPLEET
jgi:hypothetical protein